MKKTTCASSKFACKIAFPEDFVPTLVRLQVLQIVSMRARSLEHLGRVCPDSVKCPGDKCTEGIRPFLTQNPWFQSSNAMHIWCQPFRRELHFRLSCLSLLFSRVVGLQCSSKYGLYMPRKNSCGSSKDYSENVW